MKRQRGDKNPEDTPSPVNEAKKVSFRSKGTSMDEAAFRRIIGEELDKKLAVVNGLIPQFQDLAKKVENLTKQVMALERDNKKRNIVIYGVPESAGKETLLDRVKGFTDVIQKMGLTGIDCDDVRRLGLSNPSKPRPLLVKLTKMRDKMMIMKTKRQLKGANIFVDDDLSPEERRQHASLRQKLKEIRNNDTSTTGFVRLGELITYKEGQKKVYKFNPISNSIEEEVPMF